MRDSTERDLAVSEELRQMADARIKELEGRLAQREMTFDEWWEKNYADAKTETADRTFAEEVWNAARTEPDEQHEKYRLSGDVNQTS